MRDSLSTSEELLRTGNDEWLSVIPKHLSSEEMEVVGRSGGISKLEVTVLVV